MRKFWIGPIALMAALAGVAHAGDPTFEHRALDDKPPPKPTLWKANVSLGLIWVEGNAESLGVSGSALVAVKHYRNAFEFFASGAYATAGSSSVKGGPIDGTATAAENWLGRLRYDRFFSPRDSLYAAYVMSGDRPAGYRYRIEPQVGYSRIFFASPHQLVRGEIGYDYTFDNYVIHSVPKEADFHSIRLFAGYENKFTPYASFSEGVEMLWSPAPVVDHVRLNSLTSLSSTVTKHVSLKLNFTLKCNFDPPARPAPNPPGSHFDVVDSTLEAVVAVTFL